MTSEIPNRRKAGKAPKREFKPSVFINHSFSPSDKAAFKLWAGGLAENAWDVFDKLVLDGYSISIKRDYRSDGFAAFISPAADDSPNSGYILTGRAGSAKMAVLSAGYRHYVLFEGDWPTDVAVNADLDDA